MSSFFSVNFRNPRHGESELVERDRNALDGELIKVGTESDEEYGWNPNDDKYERS